MNATDAHLVQTLLRAHTSHVSGRPLTDPDATAARDAAERLADLTLIELGDHPWVLCSKDIADAYQGMPARDELGGVT